MTRKHNFWREESGSGIAEFAMVVPVFFALMFGLMNMCFVLFFNAHLHYAVDDAARCMSVNPVNVTNSCSSASNTQTHAGANFNFPSLSPSFTASSQTCGDQVVGTATYRLNLVVAVVPMTLNAKACFPIQD